jgi:hypothetical protein
MKLKSLFLALSILISTAAPLSAIELDEILDQHMQALGGRENLARFESFHYVADLKMGGMNGKAEMYYEKPGKVLLKADLSVFKIAQGLYNGKYWMKDQTGTLRELSGYELKMFKTELYISSYEYLLNDDIRKHFSYEGDVEFDGRQCHKLVFAPPDGDRTELFIDNQDYLVAGTYLKVQGLPIKVTYSDWRRVEGVKFPFRTVQDMGNPLLMTVIEVTGLEMNTDIPDAVFIPPTTATADHVFEDDDLMTDAPLRRSIHHIYVPLKINGQGPFMFLLDSGAGMTIVGRRIADSLGLKDIGNMPAAGVGGIEVANFCRIDSLRVGELTMFDLTGGVLDLSFFNTIALIPLDGILGYDLFAQLIVEIDYEDKELKIYDPRSDKFKGGEDTLDIRVESNHPIVTSTINDSINGQFRMDTGSHNFLDLNTPLVRKYKLLENVNEKLGEMPLLGIGGSSKSTLAYLNSFSMGDYRLTKVLTGFNVADSGIFSAENVDGNIGGGILSMFKIAFDYPEQKVYLTKYEEAEESGSEFISSGIVLRKSDGIIEIFRVMPGTPAEEIGLQESDRLISIEGEKLTEKSLKEVYDLLSGDEGDKFWIEYERDSRTRKAQLQLKKIY